MWADAKRRAIGPWLGCFLGACALAGALSTEAALHPALAQAAPADPAPDDTTIYDGLNVDDWTTLARENGVQEIALDPGSSRTGESLKTLNGRIAGLDTRLTLYDCDEDGDCGGVVFTTYLDDKDKFTPALLNKFNSERIAHLVLVDDSLRLELTTAFAGGVTRTFLADQLSLFAATVAEAVEFKP